MIKGCRKNMIIVRCEDDSRFESAYFIMKNDATGDDGDLLSEANKIIEKNLIKEDERGKNRARSPKKGVKRGIIPFAAGATLGSAAWLIWLFL